MHMEWFMRLLLATICGGLIGRERKVQHKDAGSRTHAFLALGSAVLMIVSIHGFPDTSRYDAARVAAQVVSGVGFLGAGVIFEKKGNVSGLTTAAGMWLTAAVGLCFGAGMYDIGIFTTVVLLGIQVVSHSKLYKKYIERSDE